MPKLRNHHKVWLVGATFVIGALCFTGVMTALTSGEQTTISDLRHKDLTPEIRLGTVLTGLTGTRTALSDASRAVDNTERAAQLQRAVNTAASAAEAWQTYTNDSPATQADLGLRRKFERAQAAASETGKAAGLAILGAPSGAPAPADPAINANLDAVDAEIAASTALQDQEHAQTLAALTRVSDNEAELAVVGPAILTVVLLLGLIVTFLCARSVKRQELLLQTRDAERDEAAKRNEFDARISRAFDMATSEERAFVIARGALAEALGTDSGTGAELLLADSSQAHFRRALATDESLDACAVTSPDACPVARRSVALTFTSNSELDTCPYLYDLGGARSAACVPVNIGNQAVGVIRTDGPDHQPPEGERLDEVSMVARKLGDRVAMLRAFSDSETQARTDPLTGLLNRRSLENRVHELTLERTDYVIAYGDLDHFKDLNDAHGHETGDRALRLFARVLRDAVRPSDVPARYGGEEFVIVLPDCTVDAAVAVIERVREHLALALSTGGLPPFTASFGIATGTEDATFDEIVARADEALLVAKRDGRNRVVTAARLAGEPGMPVGPLI